jgi:uncharacterized tellurite resistance protein B-like protein
MLAAVDAEEREKVVGLIETMIAADGVVGDAERDFLRRALARWGISESDRADRPAVSATGVATATLRGLAPDVRVRVMALLVEAAIVDGQVSPEERALLLASAASLGIEAQALEERIAQRLQSKVPGI